MKRILASILLLCLLATLCACGATEHQDPTVASTNPTEPTEELVIPEVKLIINLDQNDTENHLRVFPANRTGSQEYARIHIYVESEKETEQIRQKLERKYGKDDLAWGDFVVGADKIYDIPANEWYNIRTSVNSSSLCFVRITLYYGEHEILLDSKTIYTPYTNPQYTESDFDDTPPAYRPMEGMNDEEQALFDKCQFAVTDYAASSYYLSVKSFEAWQGSERLYVNVVYEVTDGTEEVWFTISNADPTKYGSDSSAENVVPQGEGTDDQIALADFFYVRQALTKLISE